MHSLAQTSDENRFVEIVENLCRLAGDKNNEDQIRLLEEELQKNPNCIRVANFGIVKGELMDIDFYFQPDFKSNITEYRAEYYDGFSAPYSILFWNGTIKELDNIVKNYNF